MYGPFGHPEAKKRIARYEKKMEECDNFSDNAARTKRVPAKSSC